MAHIARRFLSSSRRLRNNVSAQDACAEIYARFADKPISIRKQLFDANQVHLLNVTLGRDRTSYHPPKDGTPIPPGYHLVYFTPSILEEELGLDGTDRTVNPLNPFTRRMWAGGELKWAQEPKALLRVGQTVQETTRMLFATPKTLKSGDSMLVVGVEKTLENGQGVALVDRRNWVFQEEITTPKPPAPRPEEVAFPEGEHAREFRQTPVSLFRFSALTMNAHKIHWSPEWCREIEGHRDAVVHGPLNLINMLDLWYDTAGKGNSEAVPNSVFYRATSPIYVGEKYQIVLDEENAGWRAEIHDSFGKVGMKGTIRE